MHPKGTEYKQDVALALREVLSAEIAEGWMVDRVIDLIDVENVDQVISMLPEPFRSTFLEYCRDQYELGEDVPTTSIPESGSRHRNEAKRALRDWLAKHELAKLGE
jgi:hypothetical protein